MLLKTEAIWTHEPAEWRSDVHGRLYARARGGTDFWRKTRTGFIAENGHLYSSQVRGDFIMRVQVSGAFHDLYDQAGLMVLLDAGVWIKAGIELVEGQRFLSSVVTRDVSDWALCRPLLDAPLWLTMERDRDAIVVSASLDGQEYFMVRECILTNDLAVEAGLYLCAPTGPGFSATFERFEIELPRQPRRPPMGTP